MPRCRSVLGTGHCTSDDGFALSISSSLYLCFYGRMFCIRCSKDFQGVWIRWKDLGRSSGQFKKILDDDKAYMPTWSHIYRAWRCWFTRYWESSFVEVYMKSVSEIQISVDRRMYLVIKTNDNKWSTVAGVIVNIDAMMADAVTACCAPSSSCG